MFLIKLSELENKKHSHDCECFLFGAEDEIRTRDPRLTLPAQAIVKGDNKSISIAAASIIAKVYRDHLMDIYDKEYPAYGFAVNKGYPTEPLPQIWWR